jgi:hypothetical protein
MAIFGSDILILFYTSTLPAGSPSDSGWIRTSRPMSDRYFEYPFDPKGGIPPIIVVGFTPTACCVFQRLTLPA